MKAVLTGIGDTYLKAERARQISDNSPDDTELKRQAVEAIHHLERAVSQAIELGRRLILQEVEHSDYGPEEIDKDKD